MTLYDFCYLTFPWVFKIWLRWEVFGRENIPALMAAVVVISVPLIVLFLIFRKKIMAGVSRGGTKG